MEYCPAPELAPPAPYGLPWQLEPEAQQATLPVSSQAQDMPLPQQYPLWPMLEQEVWEEATGAPLRYIAVKKEPVC